MPINAGAKPTIIAGGTLVYNGTSTTVNHLYLSITTSAAVILATSAANKVHIITAMWVNGNTAAAFKLQSATEDVFLGAQSTIYYLRIQRISTTGTVKVYSDSARTNLLDTLSVTVETNTYRYINVCSGYDQGGTTQLGTASGYSENLDLQEGTSRPPQLMKMGIG